MTSGLLVYVPSLKGKGPESATLLKRLAADLGPSWRIERWEHGLNPLSRVSLEDVAHRLAVQVRDWAGDNGTRAPVDEVILVGHSIGGLLVRYAYLLDAQGSREQQRGPYPWTRKVRRLALMAAPNAGFDAARLPLAARLAYSLAAPVLPLTAEQVQQGSAFITELRLRWVDAFGEKATWQPEVVQVLGDQDALVTRADSMDVEYMKNATHLDVPEATHGNVVDVEAATEPESRYALLRKAVLEPLDRNEAAARAPSEHPVVFVLHGIRTSAYASWVEQLTTEVRARRQDALIYAPSYGYFSAAQFALPVTRSRNTRTFLAWYSRAYVAHQGAELLFAGHSNGTYMLGQSLLAVPALRFKRIYLAGSVLPRSFPWSSLGEEQVGDWMRSDRATNDRPVGWVCAVLRGLGMRDVGTAGVNGFDDPGPKAVLAKGSYLGGHGRALEPCQIPGVATFLLTGASVDLPVAEPNSVFLAISHFLEAAALPAAGVAVVATGRWLRGQPGGGRWRTVGVAGLASWLVAKSA